METFVASLGNALGLAYTLMNGKNAHDRVLLWQDWDGDLGRARAKPGIKPRKRPDQSVGRLLHTITQNVFGTTHPACNACGRTITDCH